MGKTATFRFLGLQQGGCVEARRGFAFIGFPAPRELAPGDLITVSDVDIAVNPRPCHNQPCPCVGECTTGAHCKDPAHVDGHLLPAQTEADCYRLSTEHYEEVTSKPAPAKDGEA